MKRAATLVFVCALCGTLLTGCWGQMELDQLSIVVGLCVDRQPDGSTTVNAMVVNPPLMRSGQGGGPSTPGLGYVTHSVNGPTLQEALFQFFQKPYRQLDISHNGVMVFGDNYARHGISEALDFIERSPETRKDQLLFVAAGQAANVTNANVGVEKLTSRGLEELIRHSNLSSLAYESSELNVANLALSPSHSFVLPMLKVDGREVELAGSAVFDHSRMVQQLDLGKSRGLLWWLNRSEGTLLPISCRGLTGEGTVRIRDTTTTVHPVYDHGRLTIHVTIHGIAELASVCKDVRVTSTYLDDASRSCDQEIQKEMTDVLTEFQNTPVDALQIGTRLYRQDPQGWRAVQPDWVRTLAQARVSYDIQVHIMRTGLSQNSPFSQGGTKQVPNLDEASDTSS